LSFPIIRPIHGGSRPGSGSDFALLAMVGWGRICPNTLGNGDLGQRTWRRVSRFAAKIFDNKHLPSMADLSAHPALAFPKGVSVRIFAARDG